MEMRFRKIEMSAFTLKVISIVKKIPRGKVATYGQIAKLAGKPHAARGVGWILHACAQSHDLPWQRVINSQGQISFPTRAKEHKEQKKLLQKEGIQFQNSGTIDLKKFQWKKKPRPAKAVRGRPSLFSNELDSF